jgi:hypothetical protein
MAKGGARDTDVRRVTRAEGWGFYHRSMVDQPSIATGGRRSGWTRPVSTPADVGDPRMTKASGAIALPSHVSWSGPRRKWDLDDRRQRAQVYEIVLTEGTDDDIRWLIDVDELIALWDELWLSPHVRRAWADHLRRLRGIELAC